MDDSTEPLRSDLPVQAGKRTRVRTDLETKHGQVWGADELAQEFHVLGYATPFAVVVVRKRDRVQGQLRVQHCLDLYFEFIADEAALVGGP